MSSATNRIIRAHDNGLNATITLRGAGGKFIVDCPDAEIRRFIEEGISDERAHLPASLNHAHASAMGIFLHCTGFLDFSDDEPKVIGTVR